MGRNDKSFRLQAARDLLNLKGKHEPTFKKKIELIIEILGTIHSPRNLSWCRRYRAKLSAQYPEMTPEQLQLMGVLDDRLYKKGELIKARQERKKGKVKGPKKTGPQTTPAPQPAAPGAVDIWDV
jgi:hypothetical protein